MPRNEDGAPDKVSKAEKRIESFPYDTEAWTVLIREAQGLRNEDARKVYERLVSIFPSSGKYWKIYIEHEIRFGEDDHAYGKNQFDDIFPTLKKLLKNDGSSYRMKTKNYEKVEKLFQRCLMKVLNIDLWKTYLLYIRETKGSLPSYREKMAQAYDFALDKTGMDIASYQIWADYINFLKSVEAVGSYAENQRITAVRKVYQRGVVNPMTNIEVLWNNYTAFETGINPLIAKKMQEDKSRDYMNSRRVTREYEVVTKGLNRNNPSVPPQNTAEEAKQVELWKKYINFEKSNPLRSEDTVVITKRVMYAYEQCLLCLGHHPDIWIESAAFLEQSSKILTEKGETTGKVFSDEAAAIYERAIATSLKDNPLIYFAYCDFEESRMKHEKVHTIYKRLITNQEVDPTLPYIQYMKFARRAEGIKSARSVFKLAREDSCVTYHVFVAAALMEYYCSKDKNVAFKIFELGLKKFGQHPEYIVCYIEFMGHLNEDNNTRVLFERVLSSGQLDANKSYEVWNKFLEFESNVGDLASILKVEKRRATVIGAEFEGKETALLIDRYKYLDLLPCSSVQLKSLGYKDLAKQSLVSMPQSIAKESVMEAVLEEDEGKSKYMPDLLQMLPFKPQINVPLGSHPVGGGIFPAPPIAMELMSKIPPPESFTGPFIQLDKFIDNLMKLDLETGLPETNGMDMKTVDPGTQLSIDIAMGRKRRLKQEADDSDDDMDTGTAPPSHDIFRARQQKKSR